MTNDPKATLALFNAARRILEEAERGTIVEVKTAPAWRCCECHRPDISGGVQQTSKTQGKAGHCYWCQKPVDVYFGQSRKHTISMPRQDA